MRKDAQNSVAGLCWFTIVGQRTRVLGERWRSHICVMGPTHSSLARSLRFGSRTGHVVTCNGYNPIPKCSKLVIGSFNNTYMEINMLSKHSMAKIWNVQVFMGFFLIHTK